MRCFRLVFIGTFLILMGGCSELITTDDLIGGKWLVTNGYEDGEIGGDPVCPAYEEGMEFIDEENVYVFAEEEQISYSLSESDEGMEIIFSYPNDIDFYKITMENEDAFGLNGSGMSKTRNCYFEREK